MGSAMAVDRCICRHVPFASALTVARERGCTSVAELQAHLPLGTGCGLCVPYMQCALETGRTDLPVFDEAATAHWHARSGLIEEGKG